VRLRRHAARCEDQASAFCCLTMFIRHACASMLMPSDAALPRSRCMLSPFAGYPRFISLPATADGMSYRAILARACARVDAPRLPDHYDRRASKRDASASSRQTLRRCRRQRCCFASADARELCQRRSADANGEDTPALPSRKMRDRRDACRAAISLFALTRAAMPMQHKNAGRSRKKSAFRCSCCRPFDYVSSPIFRRRSLPCPRSPAYALIYHIARPPPMPRPRCPLPPLLSDAEAAPLSSPPLIIFRGFLPRAFSD